MDYPKSIISDLTAQKIAQLKLGNILTDDEIVQQTIQDMDLTEDGISEHISALSKKLTDKEMSDLRKELTDAGIAEIRNKLKPIGLGSEMSVDGDIAAAIRGDDPEFMTVDRDLLKAVRDDFNNEISAFVSNMNPEEWLKSE